MPFEMEIDVGARADVLVDCEESAIPWPIVRTLDAHRIRACGPGADRRGPGHAASVRLQGYSGTLCRSADDDVARTARELGLPVLVADEPASSRVEEFCRSVVAHPCTVRRYAFFIGRLERDFTQARDAIRVAVEGAAGIDCLWIDDRRHTTNVMGIRERTRLLIQHAVFIVADLTLGVENPVHENPSRAHEIGIAMAYERPLCVCSQEPRRYPYFSIADVQMNFWGREDELEAAVRAWVHGNRKAVARRVLNYALPSPVLAEPTFRMDLARRFVGPNLADASQHAGI